MHTHLLNGLYCPYPSSVNPFVNEADEHTLQWVRQFNLVKDPAVLQHYHQQKFAWMVARMFPGASAEALNISANLNTLLFILDDQFDEHAEGTEYIKQQQRFEQLVSALLDIMKHNKILSAETGSPVLSAISDFWNRISKLGHIGWQVRYISSLQKAFAANLWRIEQVKQQKYTSLECYMSWRPLFSGADSFAYLLEAMEGFTLPDYVFLDDTIKELVLLCSRTICWANDLFSFTKEIKQGDELNLVMLIRNSGNCSIEEAVTKAVKIHNADVRRFRNLSKKLPFTEDAGLHAMLVRYAQALGIMMRGNIDWSMKDTNRYHLFSNTIGSD